MDLSGKDLQEINRLIMDMKETAEQLYAITDNFPAVNKNIKRILASIKMLELNVSDGLDRKVDIYGSAAVDSPSSGTAGSPGF